MSLFNQQIGLEGVFGFTVYDSFGKPKSEKIYKKNFITSTGLSYPSKFGIADCFRFLSVGTGTGANSISSSLNNGWGTTGLSRPLTGYSYIGSRTVTNDPTTSQYEPQSCGYREQNNTLTLSRGWRVPVGTGLFPSNVTLNEFMVSPGRPYITGSNQTKACTCNQFVSDDLGNVFNGLDCAAIADFYQSPSLCDAIYAFARVIQNISIAQNDYLVVNYDLQLSFLTGAQLFNFPINNSKGGANWNYQLSGYSSLVHHGLKLINDGETFQSADPFGARLQVNGFDFTNDYGESFIPPWGAPVEPTSPESNLIAYISTDDLQFLVNGASGGAYNGTPSSGVMGWRKTPTADVVNGWDNRFFNIREDGGQPYYPAASGIGGADTANNIGFDVSYITSSRWQHNPMNTEIPSSRYRTGFYAWQFWGISSLVSGFASKPVRACVLSYKEQNDNAFVPFLDLVFSEKSGAILPPVNYITQQYSLPDSNYNFMEDGADLTLSFNLVWSSPCDPSVSGC